jgi:geranylgeranylglycerol-phosphate geranylgeranyltransferase
VVTEARGHTPTDHGGHFARRNLATMLDIVAGLTMLIRIRACLAGGAAVLLGAFLSGGLARLTDGRCLAASAGIALAVAAANVVNDIVDMRADSVSKRSRPLPSGRISVDAGRAVAVVLTAGALLLAFSAGLGPGLEMTGLLTLAIGYSWAFKSTVLFGNVVVACCASFPVLYGGVVAGSVTRAIWVACALSFLFILAYETLKTLRDRESDAAVGLRTLATRADPRSSARLFVSWVVVLASAVLAASVVSSRVTLYLLSILPLLVLLGFATAPCYKKNLSDSSIQRSLRLLRLAWLVGLVDMLLLR